MINGEERQKVKYFFVRYLLIIARASKTYFFLIENEVRRMLGVISLHVHLCM
jgi:hypothetical protein